MLDVLVISQYNSKLIVNLLNSQEENVKLVFIFKLDLITIILKFIKSRNNDFLQYLFLLETIQSKNN